MPHSNEPQRFERIADQMQSVKLLTLSRYLGGDARPADNAGFPPVGETDGDVFGNNLLEVMQFVFNHTTFDPNNPEDQAVLAAYARWALFRDRSTTQPKLHTSTVHASGKPPSAFSGSGSQP